MASLVLNPIWRKRDKGVLFTPSYSLLGKSNFHDPKYGISLNDSLGQLFLFFASIGGSYLREGDFLREANKRQLVLMEIRYS